MFFNHFIVYVMKLINIKCVRNMKRKEEKKVKKGEEEAGEERKRYGEI